jgi:pilus assembly protein CpaF
MSVASVSAGGRRAGVTLPGGRLPSATRSDGGLAAVPALAPDGRVGGVPHVELGAELLDRVQRRLWSTGRPDPAAGDLEVAVAAALRDEGVVLPAATFAATVRAVTDELTGLGPLAPLLADPAVTDVLVNGPDEVWVDRQGRLERTPVRLSSTAALSALVQRVVAPLGLRVDEARPWGRRPSARWAAVPRRPPTDRTRRTVDHHQDVPAQAAPAR